MQPLRGMLQQYGALLFGRSGSQLQSNPFLCKETNEFNEILRISTAIWCII
ncbi:hypothetical protein D3C73_1382790 [compost metagenome]